MSLVHKVIVLNTPMKIRGFTIPQWLLLGLSVLLAFFFGSKVPPDWKIHNLPFGFIVGLTIVCAAMLLVNASEMKPAAWWKNLFLYKVFNAVPRVYHSRFEEQAQIYPDPDVIDIPKREQDGYIELGA